MGQIADIEQALIDRLRAEIEGVDPLVKSLAGPDGSVVDVPVQIKSYPSSPTESTLKTLAAAGAVLVRYTGSRYAKPRQGTGWMVQDRSMLFEVLAVADSLLPAAASSGIYRLLDVAALRLIGHVPEGATGMIELVQDDYVAETKGSWEYGLIVSVPAQLRMGVAEV